MHAAEQFLQGLNPAQREAVVAPPGPLLIIAGAGSGKTRVLTHRIAYFIASGIDPRSILAITFTNKAADEMRQRVLKLTNDTRPLRPTTDDKRQTINGNESEVVSRQSLVKGALPFVGTFHALALRILREDSEKLGIPRTFTIADDTDSHSIMKRVMKQLKVSAERITPSEVLQEISARKSELEGPEGINDDAKEAPLLRVLYKAYQDTLAKETLLDFDDLLFRAVELFEKHAAVLEKYRRRYRHIFVDEYQDTNTAQYRLVRLLVARVEKSITVVGDDYQAIYGWRGADYRNILNFTKDYPNARVVKLEQNYRSTQKILDAADGIIKKITARTEKTLVATREEGEKVTVTELANEEEEAVCILEAIYALKRRRLRLSDGVVRYGTNAQSRPFEELLLASRIPYRIIGGLRFYERREIKDILAFLRYLKNENDGTALERMVNVPPRGIGKVGLERIREHGITAVAASSASMREFQKLLETLRAALHESTLSQFIKKLTVAVGYRNYLREAYATTRTWKADQSQERWENVEELVGVAKRYDALAPAEALERFLEDIALFSHADTIDTSANTVNLMTMHLAKGLEFPVVFVAGCEEGLLPHARSMYNPEALDEERRLCYVAITRAKDAAHLTFTRERLMHGERTRRTPSRFLADIPDHAAEFHGKSLHEDELIEELEE